MEAWIWKCRGFCELDRLEETVEEFAAEKEREDGPLRSAFVQGSKAVATEHQVVLPWPNVHGVLCVCGGS